MLRLNWTLPKRALTRSKRLFGVRFCARAAELWRTFAAAFFTLAFGIHLPPSHEEAKAKEPIAYQPSALANFPIQIKLMPVNAPYLHKAHLLIAADCTAYAYGNFHRDFMEGKVTVIACPKLDMVDYSQKLAEVFRNNDILSVTVTRMTVPCCGGLPYAVENGIRESGKNIPLHIVTIDPRGQIQ